MPAITTIDFTAGTVISSTVVENKFNELIDTGFIKGYPKTILNSIAVLGNVGVGLDTIHTFSLSANSLENNGDYLEVIYGGATAANNNDKRIQISIDGTAIDNTGLIDLDGIGWFAHIIYTRLTATTVRANTFFGFGYLQFDSAGAIGGGSSGRYMARSDEVTVLNLNSNAIILLVQAEGVADNDITNTRALIRLCKMT